MIKKVFFYSILAQKITANFIINTIVALKVTNGTINQSLIKTLPLKY